MAAATATIAGSTSYNAVSAANQASACASAKEWNRTDAGYATLRPAGPAAPFWTMRAGTR
jgi:hypothetical protein